MIKNDEGLLDSGEERPDKPNGKSGRPRKDDVCREQNRF